MGVQGDEETGKGSLQSSGKLSSLRFNSPLMQIGLIGLVCFCCPGMFNALSGMGGGGQVDPTAVNNANTALYICCRYNGFYKGVQSAGAAVAWQVDAHRVPFLNQLIVNWVLTTISYPLLAVLIFLAVKDDNKAEEGTSKELALPSAIHASTDDANGGLGKST